MVRGCCVELSLSLVKVDKIINCNTQWRGVKEELRVVTDSSEVGRRMLGFAWEKVQHEISTEKMNKVIEELKHAPIIAEAMAKVKATLASELVDYDGVATKRISVVHYRGVAVQIPVQSIHEETMLRTASLVKGIAVDLQVLQPLFCENELVAKPRPAWAGITVEAALLKEWAIARSTANSLLGNAEQTGEAVQEALQRKQTLLTGMDASFALEVAFFGSMLGDAGTARLQQEILRCFPTEGHMVTLTTCAQNLTQLAQSPLMRFVTKNAQGIFKAVREAVASLELGRRPTFDSESTNAAFMTSVVGRLGFFVEEEAAGVAAGSGGARVYGAAALKIKYEKLAKAIMAGVEYGLADIEPFQMFGWLVEDAMKKEVDRWTHALLAGLGDPTTGVAASSSGDVGKGGAAKKKAKPDPKGAVMSLFM